jgi:hypothetical protein
MAPTRPGIRMEDGHDTASVHQDKSHQNIVDASGD